VLVDGKEVKALGLFKKGITPEWEDAQNRDGAEFSAVKTLSAEALDIHWENVVMALIGEGLEEDDNICGCRLVHQGKKMRNGYKVEIWLKKRDEEIANRLKSKLAECLSDGSEKLKPHFRITATDFANFIAHSQ
jgi:translation initiation factor 4E